MTPPLARASLRPAYWTGGGRLDNMATRRSESRYGTMFSMLTEPKGGQMTADRARGGQDRGRRISGARPSLEPRRSSSSSPRMVASPQGRASSRAGSGSRNRRSPTCAVRSPTRACSAGLGPDSPSAVSSPSLAALTSRRWTWSRSSTTRVTELETGSDETIQLAVLDGVEMTYLARHDGRQPVRLTSQIGRRLPASVTATGKAALASLRPGEVDRRLGGHRAAEPDPPVAPERRRAPGGPRGRARSRLLHGRRRDRRRRCVLRHRDPRAWTRRGAIRREHHAAQGTRNVRSGTGADRRPAPSRRPPLRSAPLGTGNAAEPRPTVRSGRSGPRSRRRSPRAPRRTDPRVPCGSPRRPAGNSRQAGRRANPTRT